MKPPIILAAVLTALTLTAAAQASSLSSLRSSVRAEVRSIEQNKTTLRFFTTHAFLLYKPATKARAWHVVALARQRVIRGRARLVELRGALARMTPRTVYEQAHAEALRQGVTESEWRNCLVPLITRENGNPPASWNPTQWNRSGSGAFGLPQALPGSKMAAAGSDWATNPATQVRWMTKYLRDRYGSPCAGDRFQRSRGYY